MRLPPIALTLVAITSAACGVEGPPTTPELPEEVLTAAHYAHPGPITVVENLGLPAGAVRGWATDLNASRVIVGTMHDPAALRHAFQWTAATGMQRLAEPGLNLGSRVGGINNAGVVVGDLRTIFGDFRGVRWLPGGTLDHLGLIGPRNRSSAHGINNSGVIVGESGSEVGDTVPTIAGSTGGFSLSADFPVQATASAINDNGWVAGLLYEASGRGWLFKPGGGVVDLAPPEYGQDVGAVKWISAVNQQGTVVGSGIPPGANPAGPGRGMVWDGSTVGSSVAPSVLGTLGGDMSSAQDINDNGLIVGVSHLGNGSPRGFKQLGSGPMTRLPMLPGAVESTAGGVNNAGHIVGSMTHSNGVTYPTAWWYYASSDVKDCTCPPPLIKEEWLVVTMAGSRDLKVLDIAMNTVTIGAPRGPSPRASIAEKGGEPMVKYTDTNRDGLEDALLYFSMDELTELGLEHLVAKGSLLTGASADRSYGVGGLLPAAEAEKPRR